MTTEAPSGPPTRIIAVISHRGGSGKTAIATGLCSHLEAQFGQRVLLVDCCPDGAAAYLAVGSPQPIKPVDTRQVDFLPLIPAAEGDNRVVWAPGCLRLAQFWDLALKTCMIHGFDFVVVDAPVASCAELAELLKRSWLAVVAVPCDGPAFRSIGPLLEGLNEERARPARNFEARAVMTMTGVPNPERMALETFQKRYLRPMLSRNDIPFDPELRRIMAAGRAPARNGRPSAAVDALAALAGEVVDLANPRQVATPVG